MSRSTIAIDRVPLQFLAATTPARAEQVARRVRDAITAALPRMLAAVYDAEMDADERLVFIDRIEAPCVVATHWSDEAIARAFARSVALALVRGRDGVGAIVFNDRVEFIGAFIAALIDGHAFSRWWFSEFDGLRVLPLSTCLRTLVEMESVATWQAFARLSPDLQRQCASALSAGDAERVLAAVERGASGALAPVGALIDALEGVAAVLPPGPNRLVLSLAVLERRAAGAASSQNLAALRVLTKLLDGMAGEPPPQASPDPAGVLIAWCDRAGIAGADRAIALRFQADALVRHIAERQRARGEAGIDRTDAPVIYTPHGGAIVLCVLLAKLGWWRRWRDWLRGAGASQPDALAAELALAVAARAVEPDRRLRVQEDPALRRVFAAPSPKELADIDRFSRRLLAPALSTTSGRPASRRLRPLIRAAARALVTELGEHIPGCAGSSARYLRTRCLRLTATVHCDGRTVHLGHAPLDVLLRLAGLKRAAITLPDGRELIVREGPLP